MHMWTVGRRQGLRIGPGIASRHSRLPAHGAYKRPHHMAACTLSKDCTLCSRDTVNRQHLGPRPQEGATG
jgi:hypothetical protein